MTTIEVPGTAPAPPGSQGVKLGVAGFSILLGAVLAWAATASGDPSLWFVFAVFILVVAAFIGWLACNHVGRAGRVRLTWCAHRAWSRGCWAALESRGGQLLMLTTSIVMMLIPAGVIISLPEAGIVMPLLIGVIGLMGTVDGILSLRNPVGWFFDQYIIAIVGPGKRLAAFSWAEVEKVELGRGGGSDRARAHSDHSERQHRFRSRRRGAGDRVLPHQPALTTRAVRRQIP